MSLLWGRACIMTDLASLVQAEEGVKGVTLSKYAVDHEMATIRMLV